MPEICLLYYEFLERLYRVFASTVDRSSLARGRRVRTSADTRRPCSDRPGPFVQGVEPILQVQQSWLLLAFVALDRLMDAATVVEDVNQPPHAIEEDDIGNQDVEDPMAEHRLSPDLVEIIQ